MALTNKFRDSKGFNLSIYVKESDVDFWNTFLLWCEINKINKSEAISMILKTYFLGSKELFKDFFDIYTQVVDNTLDNTVISYDGEVVKLKELIEREYITPDCKIKMR